jgi:hypothetical protein
MFPIIRKHLANPQGWVGWLDVYEGVKIISVWIELELRLVSNIAHIAIYFL